MGEIHTSRIAITSDALTRAVTPDPAPPEPEPEGGTSFSQLSRLEQLYQIRSHLHDIILETYQPAQWRNDLFHGVSNQRDTLGRFIQYGDISEAEIADFFIPELERWALRAERRQPTHEVRLDPLHCYLHFITYHHRLTHRSKLTCQANTRRTTPPNRVSAIRIPQPNSPASIHSRRPPPRIYYSNLYLIRRDRPNTKRIQSRSNKTNRTARE